jgi:hypothetical protein
MRGYACFITKRGYKPKNKHPALVACSCSVHPEGSVVVLNAT